MLCGQIDNRKPCHTHSDGSHDKLSGVVWTPMVNALAHGGQVVISLFDCLAVQIDIANNATHMQPPEINRAGTYTKSTGESCLTYMWLYHPGSAGAPPSF